MTDPNHLTGRARQKITVSIDAELLRRARLLAANQNTSLQLLIREFLEQEVREARHRSTTLLFETCGIEIGAATWTRDELYDR